jgi:hypothetical protein
MVKHMTNTQWSEELIQKFATADDMKVSPFYSDGKTYGTPTWIWSVVVEGQLYIRAWNGPRSRWYRSALEQKRGRIHLAKENYEVFFEKLTDETINKKVDQTYQQKYADSVYMPPMIQAGPRSTTMQLLPRK